jgi:hypothetical protein
MIIDRFAGDRQLFWVYGRYRIGIPLALLISCLFWCNVTSKALPAVGAIVAVLRVLTIGRPVIRLGYQNWVSRETIIDGGTFSNGLTEKEEERQQKHDACAVQCYGPLLVILGTLMNGFSVFLH